MVTAANPLLNVLGLSQESEKPLIFKAYPPSFPSSGGLRRESRVTMAAAATRDAWDEALEDHERRMPPDPQNLAGRTITLYSHSGYARKIVTTPFATGSCPCKKIRYALTAAPLLTHCCHCSWCQRETGSAFAVNAMIETSRLIVEGAALDLVVTPSASGKGQKIARCPACRVAVWSHYATLDTKLAFVRAGTLDNPSLAPPDVHIFTSTKQPWVILPAGAEAYAEFYSAEDRKRMMGPEAFQRRAALLEEVR
jgi:hypothetical protein